MPPCPVRVPGAPARFEVRAAPELSEDVHATARMPIKMSTKNPRMKLLLPDAAAPDMPLRSPRNWRDRVRSSCVDARRATSRDAGPGQPDRAMARAHGLAR